MTGFAKLCPLLVFLMSIAIPHFSCEFVKQLSKFKNIINIGLLRVMRNYPLFSPYNDVSDGICWNKYTLSDGSTYRTDGNFAICLLNEGQNVGTYYMLNHLALLIQHYKSKLGSFSPTILWFSYFTILNRVYVRLQACSPK